MPQETDEVEIREYRTEDEAACLTLRNKVFPPITAEDWRRGDTAAVAYRDGTLVGVIPFVFRRFALRGDLNAMTAVANSVAVAEECRGLGIGTKMMAAAATFLRDRVDAMMVYTGDEAAGRPYRFYRSTGHVDLAYPVKYRLRDPGKRPAGFAVKVSGIDAVEKMEDQLLAVFRASWGNYGGHVRREPGYYRRALSSHIFVELPNDRISLVCVLEKEQIGAYAIVGVREAQAAVLEWAWTSPRAESALVNELYRFGLAQGADVAVWSCRAPFRPFGSPEAVWERDGRDAVVVGRMLRPERIWAHVGSRDSGGPLPGLKVWTPERKLLLDGSGGSVAIEMKEWQFHQMMFSRRSLENDVRSQLVTVAEGGWEDITEVSNSLQAAMWEYHHLDYI